MAIIEDIVGGSKDGCILVKDDQRKYPVSICGDGTKDLLHYLKSAENPKTRERYSSSVSRLRDPMSRYVLKLAIDNADRSKEIIKKIETAIENK